jgi:hypothetical protein
MIDYIWGGREGDAGVPIEFVENVDLQTSTGKEYTSLPHLQSADEITVHLKNNFISKIFVLHPKVSNHLNTPLIYHSGHNIVFFREDHHVNDSGLYSMSTLDFFLRKGFDIIGISMPIVGYNDHPDSVTEKGHAWPIQRHDDLFQLQTPFYYFLAPVKACLDFLSAKKGYHRFIMMGLSGGGWTTTLYSAIDTRIWLSFPVAGSIPVPWRTSKKDEGDKEQYFAGFYNRFNYSTLYTLAGAGPDRFTCQILNKKDDCCFAFDADKYWAGKIEARLAEMKEAGHYRFFQDRFAPFHKVSSVTTRKIYAEIREAFAREGILLPSASAQ